MMTVMAMRLRKGRGREQQHQGQDNQLLHAAILARISGSAAVEIAAGTISVSPSPLHREKSQRAGKAA
jgi:hypothetical protein